ncbi:MAG: hypothetical protein P4L53_23240 [Candidatus Obscuribacterales bacterium]|nr:hypothetical protein [Candidatus Obscuribacterales bacterium]
MGKSTLGRYAGKKPNGQQLIKVRQPEKLMSAEQDDFSCLFGKAGMVQEAVIFDMEMKSRNGEPYPVLEMLVEEP